MNYYSTNAEQLAEQYNRLDPAQVHGHWLQHLPATPGMACDIGAGTGRDANWLAEKGWHVTAVEPCKALREISKSSSNANVTWLDDTLPEIKKLRALNNQYNLILISAVWMHIPPGQAGKTRERAFRILTDLLAPGGIIVFTLRHSSNIKASEKENAARGFYPVSADELEHFAKQRAVAALACHKTNDQLKRSHVTWETLVFKLPDDGTGSLPLLRHIIVNDNKSATYKLGLIRALIRIAEGAPGMVLKRSDDAVTIPFGLVALYWLKLYMPLVHKHNIIQAPKANHADQSGYGWANENFWQLANLSGNDLRIGAAFTGDDAKHIKGALARACENIQKMPAHYITWPGTNNPIFECERLSNRGNAVRASGASQPFILNKQNLAAFGTFQIPAALWQTLGQYACWLEPAIINEWVEVMHPWNHLYEKNTYHQALQWNEANRDTRIARQQAQAVQQQLHTQQQHLHCVWTNATLKGENYHIDHCFPWSRWYNNDLWNLLPASTQANSNKKEKLPSAPLMQTAKTRILHWWQSAYTEGEYQQQFFTEAEAALPLVEEGSQQLEPIFDAMLHQRAKLKANQQLVEWGI